MRQAIGHAVPMHQRLVETSRSYQLFRNFRVNICRKMMKTSRKRFEPATPSNKATKLRQAWTFVHFVLSAVPFFRCVMYYTTLTTTPTTATATKTKTTMTTITADAAAASTMTTSTITRIDYISDWFVAAVAPVMYTLTYVSFIFHFKTSSPLHALPVSVSTALL